MKPPATGWLLAHFAGGFARAQPGRALVQVAAIAIGVALGAAVHLINESDLAELSAAERSLSGAADLSVVGPPEGFRATDTSPASLLEVDATLDASAAPAAGTARPRGASLRIVGIDALRSALIEPDLVGTPAGSGAALADLLGEGLFVSPAALAQLHHLVGDSVTLVVGARRIELRIVGELPAARDAIATMDLGFAQWRAGYQHVISELTANHGPQVIKLATDQESMDQIADKVLIGLNGRLPGS